ncbi:unnamed protein product [Cylicostephanus goldi]|uniref:Uncharacterized protein n=1 Tax=Cylicostephanus goldi TaxID=71465 RepID=A0A3P6RP42_CYLGO|nr:unnamed protein product [Cylicostephanus goldi]
MLPHPHALAPHFHRIVNGLQVAHMTGSTVKALRRNHSDNSSQPITAKDVRFFTFLFALINGFKTIFVFRTYDQTTYHRRTPSPPGVRSRDLADRHFGSPSPTGYERKYASPFAGGVRQQEKAYRYGGVLQERIFGDCGLSKYDVKASP